MIEKFLTGLWNYLSAYITEPVVINLAETWSPVDEPGPDEPLARFIYDRKHFGGNRVKYRAFLPREIKIANRFETSVFRVFGLSSDEIVELSRSARQDKQPKAAAHHQYKHIQEIGLELDPNNEPERHADIIAWPQEKYERIDLARQLAGQSNLERYEDYN